MNEQGVNLVLQLLRTRFAAVEEPTTPLSKVAFKQALVIAGQHSVTPSLAEGMRRLVSDESDWKDLSPFTEILETRNTARNLELLEMLNRIMLTLLRLDGRAVVMKGGAFLIEEQQPAPWRQLTDIDLLVDPEEINLAGLTLIQSGFNKSKDIDGFDAGIHHHYPPLSEASGHFVELHTRLMQNPKDNLLSTDAIFSRAEAIEKNGQTFLIPCPEHRMIHLIAHAQISNWGYVLRQIMLKDLVDAIELSRRHAIDWDKVRSAFARIKAEKELMGFVSAAHELLGLELTFSQQDLSKGKAWAERAIAALYQPEEGWRRSTRIMTHYLKLYGREPARLKLAWKTLKDPARLKQLIDINRGRLG